ncbi:tripartite tricarboxylate transporter substrate binding protein [soil metagenome]
MNPSLSWPRCLRAGLTALTAASALILTLGAGTANAQVKFPSQPIRVIVPFAPGGLADISMRLVAQKLGERLGQQVIVDNRPGAGGVIAANAALAAPPDGHTLILLVNGTAIAKSLFKQLPYDPVTDFAPISTIAYFDLVLLTRADGPLRTVADIRAPHAKPLVLGTINPGSTQNLSAELFKSSAQMPGTIVPYKATPEVLTGMIRGDVDVGFESYAALKGSIDAGQLRPIAVTGLHRAPWLPNVPTVREAGLASYEVTGWNALFAPARTPLAVQQLLNREVNEVLALPEVKARLLELGTDGRGSTQAEMATLLKNDIAKWAAVIRQAGIQPQ